MQRLLALSRLIDRATIRLGQAVSWLIVVAVIISAGNAVVRKLLATSSNAWLDLQWWLFAAVFLLAAPWTLAANEHIRIDILNSRWSRPVRNAVEIVGHVFFLLPMAALVLWSSWHYFLTSWRQNEQAINAGGLPQWPIKALIPAAFAILLVQGLSELIKRVAVVRGLIAEPHETHHAHHEAMVEAAEAIAYRKDADRT